MDPVSRRTFIRGTGLIAVGLVAPRWLSTVAQADLLKTAQGGKIDKDTVLVVCQFSGGNDGLNTVIPYGDSLYYQLRPTLGIPDSQVLKLDGHMGLHPSLTGLHQLYQQGKVAVIQNVGYPNPNRSHFESMRIWQSASPDRTLPKGWIGRYLDEKSAVGPLNPVVAFGLSNDSPLAIQGEHVSVPCFASLQDMQNLIGSNSMEAMLRQMQSNTLTNTDEKLVKKVNDSAYDAVSELNALLKNYTPKQTYGNDEFGNGFKQISQLIATSPQTRMIYFSAGGFDTHANQAVTHPKLLKEFGDAVLSFQQELEALGKADKVVVLCFSEFGRRAAENGSGTDHGKAAPMFLIGKNVKGGLHGNNPNLANLDAGDVPFETDFRQVYATALDTWMGGDSAPVLGKQFAPLPVLA